MKRMWQAVVIGGLMADAGVLELHLAALAGGGARCFQ